MASEKQSPPVSNTPPERQDSKHLERVAINIATLHKFGQQKIGFLLHV